jgi:hypothetical protein
MSRLLTTTPEDMDDLVETFDMVFNGELTFEIDETLIKKCLESIPFPCDEVKVLENRSSNHSLKLVIGGRNNRTTAAKKMWQFTINNGILQITYGSVPVEEPSNEEKTRTISYVTRHFTPELFSSIWRKEELPV